MSIIYYPNRILRPNGSSIDRVQAKRNPILVKGAADITSTGLNVTIASKKSWQVNSIKLTFANSTQRDYSWGIKSGTYVVSSLNDYLWFQTQGPNSLAVKVTLAEGFYTGTELAAELESKLDTAFTSYGTTFTVAYTAADGQFSITPSSGTIRYIHENTKQPIPFRQSIAGHIFGWTATTAYASPLLSANRVYGLDTTAFMIDESNASTTSHFNDDIHILTPDQALYISTGTAALTMGYEVCYEEIV